MVSLYILLSKGIFTACGRWKALLFLFPPNIENQYYNCEEPPTVYKRKHAIWTKIVISNDVISRHSMGKRTALLMYTFILYIFPFSLPFPSFQFTKRCQKQNSWQTKGEGVRKHGKIREEYDSYEKQKVDTANKLKTKNGTKNEPLRTLRTKHLLL